jgi:catalase
MSERHWVKFHFKTQHLDGDVDHSNHRGDTDYFSQPCALFRLMGPAQRQALFENTALGIASGSLS